jgi:proteasome lid subunit RPN8/RPN11
MVYFILSDGLDMPPKRVLIPRHEMELLLLMAREVHPREVIALLHGEVKRDVIRISEVYLAPQSIYGESFSAFNPYQLPIDLSFIGIVHSHPSGSGQPSLEDLNHSIGRIMIILAAPYRDERDIHVYTSDGEPLQLEVI